MRNIKRLVAIMVPVVAAAAFVALPASAAPPAPPITCTGVMNSLDTTGGLIVPAGASCELGFPKVAGNVTVLGSLSTYGYSFGKNVTVVGGTITLANGGSIADNLTITGTRGTTTLGTPNAGSFHTIGGNLTYSGNALGIGDGLFIDHAKVAGNITVASNSGHYWYNLFNSTAGENITVAYNNGWRTHPALEQHRWQASDLHRERPCADDPELGIREHGSEVRARTVRRAQAHLRAQRGRSDRHHRLQRARGKDDGAAD